MMLTRKTIGPARLAKHLHAKLSPVSRQFVTEAMIAVALRDKAAPEVFFAHLAAESSVARVDGATAAAVAYRETARLLAAV